MPTIKQKIAPCLWFDTQAEEAANFYISVFKNSRITRISRYGKAGREIHGKEAGSVMVVEFEIEGQTFTGLNGGPHLNSMKLSLSRCFAKRRTRSIISGTSYPKAAKRVSAAG